MNPILNRLASLRRKVRVLDGWQGVCALLGLILGVGVLVGTLDYFAHLPSLVRAVCLVGLLVGSGAVAYRYLIRPFARPCDDLTLALRVEEAYPELNDSLASTVQFLLQSPADQERLGGSEALRQKTMKETIDKAAGLDFARILDRRAAALFGAGALCALVLAGLVAWKSPSYSQIAFWRFVEPFGEHTWTRITVAKQTPIDVLDPDAEEAGWEKLDPRGKKNDVIAKGRPYFIQVKLEGQIPKTAKVEIDGQIRSDKVIELKREGKDGQSASFVTAIDMTQQYQKFRFRVLANDGTFPPRAGAWHLVDVLPPPTLVKLDGKPSPQISISPPAYTDLPARVLDPGTRHLDLIAGSQVVLRAKANRPLHQAWIEYRPEGALVTPAAALTTLGQTNPFSALVQVAGSSAIWAKVPAKLEGDKSVFQIDFTPWITGSYTLHLRDALKLESPPDVADLKVNLDPLPVIKLLQPGSSVTALPTADVTFKFLVADELFAVKKVYAYYQRKAADGTPLDDPQITVLYEARDYGKLLPLALAQLTGASTPAADLRLRYKKLEFEAVWSLRNQFKNGDVVSVEILAEDFCDIYPTREPGRSQAIELRIIGKQDLMTQVETRLAEIQKRLQAVEQIQKKAQEAVKDTQKQDKIDQQVRDNFIEKGVQQQREVRDRIGQDAKEGIRRDADEIKRTLQENKLTGSQAYRDATKIKGTLDAIAQQELQQIEPKLAEANTDLAQNDKNPAKTKAGLEQTAKLQQSVRNALNDLLKDINPQAKMQALKKETQDLIGKQEDIRQKLDELNNLKRELDDQKLSDKDRKIVESTLKEQINQERTKQLELEEQTHKLLQEMKAAKDAFQKDGDDANAKKVDQAINQAEPKLDPKQPDKKIDKQPISQQMKDVAKQLEGKSEAPQKALQQQENIQKNLEQVLRDLEGRSEDATKKDIQDRKDAEKDLDKIAKKIEELRKEAKKIEMIQDKEERLKKKEELAKKHADLQEDINKMRHQLARLNEQRAANELNEAAKNIEKAAEDIKQGENPDQAQQKAKEEVNRAKEELKQAEEELARELLIKIADQLEMLKIRQVGSLERSENLHAKIMKRKIWTDAFLDTIEGNMEAQKSIGEETDVFKKKLESAKVFYSLLEKAKDAMDKAGTAMERRRDEGKDRREEKMNDMELKDENEWHGDTVKHQKVAVQKLERLLDSLKDEISKKKKPRDLAKEQDPMGQDMPEEKQGGMQARDGIPPTAQLKVLKAEQLDLNQRTEDFAKRNPDLKKLNDDQQRELNELSQEQERIHELFQSLFPPQQAQPEPKEGEKK